MLPDFFSNSFSKNFLKESRKTQNIQKQYEALVEIERLEAMPVLRGFCVSWSVPHGRSTRYWRLMHSDPTKRFPNGRRTQYLDQKDVHTVRAAIGRGRRIDKLKRELGTFGKEAAENSEGQ